MNFLSSFLSILGILVLIIKNFFFLHKMSIQNKIVIKFQVSILCNIIQSIFMNVLLSRFKKRCYENLDLRKKALIEKIFTLHYGSIKQKIPKNMIHLFTSLS